jgi:hypothetical protein
MERPPSFALSSKDLPTAWSKNSKSARRHEWSYVEKCLYLLYNTITICHR